MDRIENGLEILLVFARCCITFEHADFYLGSVQFTVVHITTVTTITLANKAHLQEVSRFCCHNKCVMKLLLRNKEWKKQKPTIKIFVTDLLKV